MLHIPDEKIDEHAGKIFTLVKNGENGIGVCFPTCKIGYNLTRYLSNKSILKKHLGLLYRKLAFIQIQLDPSDTLDSFLAKVKSRFKTLGIPATSSSLSQLCEASLRAGKEPFFFILDAQSIGVKVLEDILQALHQQSVVSSRVNSLLFFEKNIYSKDIFDIISRYSTFLQNILTFPLLSSEEAIAFVRTVAKEYKIDIPEDLVKNLVLSSGGNLWILKAAVRHIRDTKEFDLNKIIDSPAVKVKINIFYNMFTDSEKRDLASLCFGDSQKASKLTIDYFLQIGLVSKIDKAYILSVNFFENSLHDLLTYNYFSMADDKKITFEGKDVSSFLTTFEMKTLTALMKKRGQVISREDLAQDIWGQNWMDSYSDWAIDKLISRLRKNLQQVGLPRTIITTRKKQGFIIA